MNEVKLNTIGIFSAGGGSGSTTPVPVNDVTFYDYDGTVLYSYPKDEFLSMPEMPKLPEQPGLICQGWNWEYEDAVEYVTKYGILDVGASYITDDGTTRLYIRIEDISGNDVNLNLLSDIAGGVHIDWGDGTTEIPNLRTINAKHNYHRVGDFLITLTVAEGNTINLSTDSSSNVGVIGVNGETQKDQQTRLQRAEVGEHCKLSKYAFAYQIALKSVSIPCDSSFGSSGARLFAGCSSLRYVTVPINSYANLTNLFISGVGFEHISFPRHITNLPTNNSYTPLLKRYVIPDSVSELTNQTPLYGYSVSVTRLVYPSSVMTLNGVQLNYTVRVFEFPSHTAVPTLTSSNLGNGTKKIIVPDALYDDWTVATNWSNIADQIIKKSDWDAQNA